MATAKRFNVGIIGYALSARIFHIPLIQAVPSLRIHSIVQRHPTTDNDAAKDFPDAHIYRSAEELVDDPEVDLVVITTPPASHFQLAKLALEGEKDVVVEKPFVPTSQEAAELVALAESKGRKLTVYQNRRYDADFLTVRDLLAKGSLGRVTEFETHFDRHRPATTNEGWKATPGPGSGVVYDLGSHLMDQAVSLFGYPAEVTGFVGTQREGNTTGFEDSCTVLLHYADGLLVTVKAAVVSVMQEQLRFWIRGTKGSFKKFHLDCQEDQLKAGMKATDTGFGVEGWDKHGVLSVIEGGKILSGQCSTAKPATWTAYYEQVAKALAGEGEMPVKPEEAVGLIKLIELVRQSSKERRTLKYA